MKDQDFMAKIAVTLDQQGSRHDRDRVPQAMAMLEDLGPEGVALAPERTAGDEVQLLLDRATTVVRLVEAFTRLGGWWVGLGIGAVDRPLPGSTREARGPAYLAARRAVERAPRAPHALALEVAWPETVSSAAYGGAMDSPADPCSPELLDRLAADAEATLWLQQSLLVHRSPEGWEVTDLLDRGLTVAEAARRLGISPSAASQRHQRAGRDLGLRGHDACVGQLVRLQQLAGVRP